MMSEKWEVPAGFFAALEKYIGNSRPGKDVNEALDIIRMVQQCRPVVEQKADGN